MPFGQRESLDQYNFALDVLLPQNCLLCDSPAARHPLCRACEAALPRLPARCPVCAMPSTGSLICGSCQRKPPAFDATLAALPYLFPVDRLIGAFKFHARLQLAPWFAALLAPLVPSVNALIALPLHRTRLAERGFNQAHEVARRLALLTRTPLLIRGLVRTRQTDEQSRLPPGARARNVRGAFHCGSSLAGNTVALVDDVMTTGATLEECARTLKRAGAERVVNVVIARTLPD